MTGAEAAEEVEMTGIEAEMTGTEAEMTGAEVAGCPETSRALISASAVRTDSQLSLLRAASIRLDKTQQTTMQNTCKCSFGGDWLLIRM